VLFIRDARGKNFRHDIYAEYKATRDKMPDSLRTQISDIQLLVETMGFESIEIPGYEADDVIATFAKKYEHEFDIYILSGDKDLHALV
jgi:DNA polymerase I